MTADDLEAGILAALLHDIGQYPMAHDLLQRSAAIRAALVFGNMGYVFAPKMLGQRLAPGPHPGRRFGENPVSNRFRRSLRGLQLFQFQLKLLQVNDDLLALLTEDRAPQLLDQ